VAGKLKIEDTEVSLRKRINALAKNLSYIVLIYLGFSITYSAVTLYLNGNLPFVFLMAQVIAMSLIIALCVMPLSIPLLVTVVLLAGALIMVKCNVIIRNLNSIESAGRISVICTDKTGTITQNKMTVKWVYTPNKELEERLYCVTTQDSIFEGKIVEIKIGQDFNKAVLTYSTEYQESSPVKVEKESSLEYLFAGALLNNDLPDYDKGKIKSCQIDTSRKVTSDVTDIAMSCLFEKAILEPKSYHERFEIVKSWSLDPNSKLITKVFKDNKTNLNILFVKGATEMLLTKCNRVLGQTNKAEVFNQEYKNHVIERVDLFSQLGLRIVSLAIRELDNFDQKALREESENSLTYIGFVAIADPPRVGIRAAVSELKGAGIKPIMITGDSLNTAKSVAKEIGLLEDNQQALESPQINSLSEQDFLNTAVFARTSPDDKRAIVARYQELNYVVAMTGDGVNDAQAILAADVGIAMGATGTDVARQAAGIVLADDSFKSIVTAIRVGRGIFEKIQNIVFFYIAISIAEGLVLFGSSFVREFILLQTVQLIYLALTQFGPSIALVTDKLSLDVMKEKPRSNEGLISGKRSTALIVFTLSLAITLSIAYLLPLNNITPVFEANKVGHVLGLDALESSSALVWEQAKARTMMLSVAIIAQSVLILSLRRLNKPLYKSSRQDWNWRIWPLIVSFPVFHAVLMYVPQIQYAFSTIGIRVEIIPLAPIDWLIVLALGLAPVELLELTKIMIDKRELAKAKSVTNFLNMYKAMPPENSKRLSTKGWTAGFTLC
jgi:Ca2+-transporting ATPase